MTARSGFRVQHQWLGLAASARRPDVERALHAALIGVIWGALWSAAVVAVVRL
jgi:hypothetical protein